MCPPDGMGPSMHKATGGVGGVCFSAPHTCLAHCDRAGQTWAAMGQCMKACPWVPSTPLGGHLCLPNGMGPSMHKAAGGVGGVGPPAPHTCSAHSDKAGQTQAAMGHCMGACSWVPGTPQAEHPCWGCGPCWWGPTMCALCSTLVWAHKVWAMLMGPHHVCPMQHLGVCPQFLLGQRQPGAQGPKLGCGWAIRFGGHANIAV